jgi:SAM-dependent methyltransferase
MRDWEKHWSEGDTPWDKGAAAPPLQEYLEKWDAGGLRGARVLVPGCGSGHDVRELARAGAMPTGLDLSPTAIEVARGHEAAGEERYVAGDFFDWDGGPFDALWEHTCFCAIPPERRDDYAAAAGRLVRPGGKLIGVFYLDPDNDGDGPPFGASRDEIVEHLRPWFSLIRGETPQRGYESRVGREWLACFARHDRGVAASAGPA